jgi:integrase
VVLDRMASIHALMARLLYGTGMRLMECARLREQGRVIATVAHGKGESGFRAEAKRVVAAVRAIG